MKGAAAIVLGAVLAAGGCGDKQVQPILETPTLPANDSPAGAVARLAVAFERQDLSGSTASFTGDFVFHFSSQSDPVLAQQYGDSWGKDDEHAAMSHLFEGFTSSVPPYETFPPASEIQAAFVGLTDSADVAHHPDSTTHYRKLKVAHVDLQVTVAYAGEPIVYSIDAPHDFYLVRGDAAVLGPGQPADGGHWYIRAWDDRTPAFNGLAFARAGRSPAALAPWNATAATWGRLKATYHH